MAPIIRKGGLAQALRDVQQERKLRDPVYLVCVGTDCSTGDAFGPLVGSFLRDAGYPYVIGTLDRPCDSSTLQEQLRELPADGSVLAVDSVVGRSVGYFQLLQEPLEPGKSLGKPLPKVGDASLLGIVCPNRSNPYTALQSASLHLVLSMAKEAASAILYTFGSPEYADAAQRLDSQLITQVLPAQADRNRQE
ncbi:spore protease YyaC [Gorillibacterium sp. CAU 1737]|uniref:spore protease YyaC n=1 Tax=Gorillibacterium sp. CAU 1737 TaxID=3140362 RepID=UPI003260935E